MHVLALRGKRSAELRLRALGLERRDALIGCAKRGAVLRLALDDVEVGVDAGDLLALLAAASDLDVMGLGASARRERVERLAVLVNGVLKVVELVRHDRSSCACGFPAADGRLP